MTEQIETYGIACEHDEINGKVQMARSILLYVEFSELGDDSVSPGFEIAPIHATRGDRCLILSPDVFMAWAGSLVGVTVEAAPLPKHTTSNVMDCNSDGGWATGLEVCARWADDREERVATLSVDELWENLVCLAGPVGTNPVRQLLEMLAAPGNWKDCCGHEDFQPFDLQDFAKMALGQPEPDWFTEYDNAETARDLAAALAQFLPVVTSE